MASFPIVVIADTKINELSGLFCASFEEPFHSKDNCVCFEFIDEKYLLTISYSKGKAIRKNKRSYNIEDGKLAVDTEGEAGLDNVVFIIKSKKKFVTRLDISRGILARTFKKTRQVPGRCV